MVFVFLEIYFLCSVLYIVVCPFVLFHLTIVVSDLFRFTDSDYPFGIFKLFLINENVRKKLKGQLWMNNLEIFSNKMISNVDPP